MLMKDWMNKRIQVEDDEFDTVSAMQDVTDPVWPSSPVEPDVTLVRIPDQGDGDVVVRTVTGVIDFLEDVAEEVFNIPDNTGPKRDSKRPKGMVVDVQERAATSWRANTYDISGAGGTKIVTERDDRTRVVVTNYGPGIAYLSAQKGGQITGTNTVRLTDPAVAPTLSQRTFFTADEIWAYPAVVGTLQLVDVQDEYGAPE